MKLIMNNFGKKEIFLEFIIIFKRIYMIKSF